MSQETPTDTTANDAKINEIELTAVTLKTEKPQQPDAKSNSSSILERLEIDDKLGPMKQSWL